MKRISVGKVDVAVMSDVERICAIDKLPDGCAVCIDGGNQTERDLCERMLSKRYRVVPQMREDVAARVVCGTDEAPVSTLKTVYMLVKDDVFSDIISLCAFSQEKVEAFAVIPASYDCPESLASAYGNIVSKLLFLTDYRVSCISRGIRYDEKGAASVRSAVLATVKNPDKPDVFPLLCALGGMQMPVALSGGESQMQRVMSALLEYEDRPQFPQGVISLRCASVMNKVYKQFLLQDFGFVAPPDENLRMEEANEYLGISENVLMSYMQPNLSDDELDRIRYRLRCYKGDLLAELCHNQIVFARAESMMKRMLPDCGYAADKELDESDFRLALALAPTLSHNTAYTLAGIMKSTGLLDTFL